MKELDKIKLKVILITVPIAMIIPLFNSYVYYTYVNELKDCKCAEDKKQIYVKYSGIAMMAMGVLYLILHYIFPKLNINILRTIIALASGILYIYYAYSLIKKDCECSESWKRTYMLVHGIFILCLWIFFKLN